mmetsp:Transcript_26761/g.55861  ORF Transcript_26761/g.55861 Transcript_26761/m.55861 type:complete len:422 (+) Transcript_26761:239-1504(+)
MKSLIPISAAAAIVASLTTTATLVVAAQDLPYPKPTVRFTPYYELDTTIRNIVEEKLGYIEATWNNFGIAPVEEKRWNSLTANERDGANMLGFAEGTWDCFINHYDDYSWEELVEKGVAENYEGLGWTRDHWEQSNAVVGVPYTEARWWGQLTDTEKSVANGLCFFEDNWDKKDMNPNPSFFPYPIPDFRYRPWNELNPVTQQVARGRMDYNLEMWNNLGTSLVEKNSFFNLDPDQRAGAMELGFYTHTWDCFMNHYLSYYWSSIHEDLKVAVETLGWNEDMWSDEAEATPPSESKPWSDLTPEEKAAATRLCYFEEIWNERPITDWYDYDTGKNTAVTVDGPLPNDIDLAIFRNTGYAEKERGSVGSSVYTADLGPSSHPLHPLLALGVAVGAFVVFYGAMWLAVTEIHVRQDETSGILC